MRNANWALPAALTLSLAVPVASAWAAVEPADSRAIVVTPLSLVQVDDLEFGSLVPSTASSGLVTIDPFTGARTADGGVTPFGAATSQRAYFVGAGTPGQPVVIVLGPAPTLSDGAGNTMPILALTLDGPVLRTIPADQVVHIFVGGILRVGQNQVPGNYAATFDLTVNYF